MGGRWRSARVRSFAGLAPVPLLAVGLIAYQPAEPAPAAVGLVSAAPLDLTRPRILGAGADLDAVADRLDREPYRTIFNRLVIAGNGANREALDDHSIAAERTKAKGAKDLAFQYAINRTRRAGVPVPFATPADRQAVGDQARTLLLGMYTRSRLAVPPPLGGTDRDINTSEELLQYSTAYDTLLGAGYVFRASEAQTPKNITDLAAELYLNYRDPLSAGNYTFVLPNNPRSKSAA